ncbi:hypothetical protein FHT86_000968 [Rhizobium sp. BK313]|uniref:hypothetical protein n=1 Tax=Rhizobium sp. BK313 TaxID=2587081 RepID=UPI0010D459CF|nr:hypothetical protein [Rhizobium sp. BK313]
MPYPVEILLPVTHIRRNRTNLDLVRDELTTKFGGVTLHLQSPAEGLWDDDGDVEHDRIVVAEAMVDDLDRSWWSSYRKELEAVSAGRDRRPRDRDPTALTEIAQILIRL